MSGDEVLALEKFPGDKGAAVMDRAGNAPVYEYLSLNDCPEARPDTVTEQVSCAHALRDCPAGEAGPLLRIWRRTTQAGRLLEQWRPRGITCAADVAPGARPTLTMADITAQLMRTPWAQPHVETQPAGNLTLVNLPTYYQVHWSTTGYQPGETDQALLRGIPVRIRPTLVALRYDFGDGTTHGPTTSTGGTYPDGDIRHAYRAKGTYQTRVTTTFGADYSLDGTTWNPIPQTVTVPGPTTTITVREARAVLVQH
ncbi:hypothetical protein ACWEOW_13795 [Monashia sp. NPDC004114]